MTRLTLSGVAKSYPGAGQRALGGLDFVVESGTLTALLGPSGSGKTTILKLVAGLLTPDSGDIRLNDRSVRDLAPERRGVAMVLQSPHLFPHLTVAGNVGFGLRMRGLSPSKIAARVETMLARVRLQGLGDRRPAALSGGQQQRAALARALILAPEVLLLDEPLSSLDPGLREEMRELIRELQRETGITTLVVTHDQAEAVALADRIALLLDGRLAQHGRPEDLYRRPANETVARFFGGVNFLPGQARTAVFHCALGSLKLPGGTADGNGLLTIRPEFLRLAPGVNERTARITALTFLGTQTRVEISVAGQTLQALTTPDQTAALQVGQDIAVSLPPEALWLLPPRSA